MLLHAVLTWFCLLTEIFLIHFHLMLPQSHLQFILKAQALALLSPSQAERFSDRLKPLLKVSQKGKVLKMIQTPSSFCVKLTCTQLKLFYFRPQNEKCYFVYFNRHFLSVYLFLICCLISLDVREGQKLTSEACT